MVFYIMYNTSLANYATKDVSINGSEGTWASNLKSCQIQTDLTNSRRTFVNFDITSSAGDSIALKNKNFMKKNVMAFWKNNSN